MRIDIISLFPEIALAPLSESIIHKAREKQLVDIHSHQLRDWATGKHRKTDEYLCGGGQGMLLKPEPIFAAVEDIKQSNSRVLLMTPQGIPFKQQHAQRLSTSAHLIILCGHYEGVDHRVIDALVDEEISIGDYVLTNGAIAAAVVTDAIVRLIPGALGDARSSEDESFTDPHMLEAPAYTKPNEFMGMEVPAVLLSGDHGKIKSWKKDQALKRTQQNRPDLLES